MNSSGWNRWTPSRRARWVGSAGVFASAMLGALPASAELPIAKVNNWELSLDGRINTFVSYSTGDRQPKGTALWQGIEDKPDADGNISMTRIRSGFIQNVLGFTLKKKLTPDTLVTGRFAIWVGVSQARSRFDNPALDAREVYFKVEGPWGGALAGRALSLFGRGAILLDYEIEHEYGLGHPCAIRTVQGGACGHTGHGILFPGFNAGIVYNTPELAGLQLSAGVFDPSVVTERGYERTPYPRVEGELTFKIPKYFHASVSGMWQRIGHNDNLELNVDASGVSYSAGAFLGPLGLGIAGFAGQGLGIYAAIENYPVFSDDKFVLRHQQGVLGMASLTLGDTKIAGGFGVTQISKTENDPPEPFTQLNFPRKQTGLSAGVYQSIMKTIVLAAEFFRATYQFNQAIDTDSPAMDVIITPRQTVNFVNAGATLIF